MKKTLGDRVMEWILYGEEGEKGFNERKWKEFLLKNNPEEYKKRYDKENKNN